ncbi:hypothetical protein Vadar_030016 [Vaccinium darrowii]|uniref:Uncharacterized protein n=1 Tax=Vaccinium darrowii TaxID=229202 RepID=A0ACB7XD68_9ERIC|nr:hypothetical protein Vadar_030016 [Vaccinium darrowii]
MQRRTRYRISGIETNDGVWTSHPQEVQGEFQRHFSSIFSAGPSSDILDTVEAIPHKITDAMNRTLTQPVSETEILAALKEIGPTKAPGIDGMTAQFFQ